LESRFCTFVPATDFLANLFIFTDDNTKSRKFFLILLEHAWHT
jgi:hypothetical protein